MKKELEPGTIFHCRCPPRLAGSWVWRWPGCNLYGRAWHLPEVISGINTYWWRGYGAQPPEVVILVGSRANPGERFAKRVKIVGHITNPYGVLNEERATIPTSSFAGDSKSRGWSFGKNRAFRVAFAKRGAAAPDPVNDAGGKIAPHVNQDRIRHRV